ncbi:MAG: hypothetical protein JWQ96_1001 [Segetibacter sp.]|nr:hypothetical protein [Segetibacter sp.]
MQEATFLNKISSFFNQRPIAVLLLFFCISVTARIPNLGRPLSKHHELNTALVLINAEEWNNKGASLYHFVPVNTYHLPGDNVYNDQPYMYMINQSFGSLWYIMPYAFLKLLHSPPSPLLLQVFNLLLHLVTVLLVYRIALILFRKEPSAMSKALLVAVLYMFSPGPLWFHGNTYVHEIAVLPFIFGAALLYLQLQTNQFKFYKACLISLLIAAGVCCDWLMCFVAFALFVISVWKYYKQRDKQHLYTSLLIALGVVAGLAITIVQFGSFMGYENYFNALVSRYNLRGVSADVGAKDVSPFIAIPVYYIISYGIFIPAIVFIYTYYAAKRKKVSISAPVKKFIAIAVAICLSHHFIFKGFTVLHDYSVTKAGIIISLLTTVAVFATIPSNKWKAIVVAAFITINLGVYYYINPPGKFAANGHPYSYFKTLGEHIKEVAKPTDYIFIDTPEMSLLLTYYSKRFYRNVQDQKEAEAFFKELPGKSALFIHTDDFKFINYTKLEK